MSFDTERFIREIENRPCLWNNALEEYSDRNLKIKSWKEIANIFKEKDDMTNEEKNQLSTALQRRWKSIRGCFTREVGRQKKVMSGSDGGPRKNEYVFFQQLQFLKNVVAVKDPEYVVKEEPEYAVKEEHAENSEPDMQMVQHDIQMVQRKKRKRTRVSTCSEDDNNIFREAQKSTETRENVDAKNDDEDRLFMLSLVGTLKKVPPEKKMATKIKLMSVLDSATNPECYLQSTRAQSQQIQPSPSSYRTGYSNASGSSETAHRCPVCQITPKLLPLL